MKLEVPGIVMLASVVVIASAVSIGLILKQEKSTVSCIEVLKKHANAADEKMVLPNADGGLVLLIPGNDPSEMNFLTYVGPKSATKMESLLTDSGLRNVVVKVGNTCETEGGLVYTLVRGSYTVPEEKPDPI